LMSMKSQIEAARALTYEAALALDMAANGDAAAQAKVDILTPIVKACGTDMSLDVTSTGVQIHGGMGFVEETGAAQYYRDARILPIYEGTNGIQAMDLAFRKTLRDGGQSVKAYIAELEMTASGHAGLENALTGLIEATNWMIESAGRSLDETAASSVPYLKCFGVVTMGVMMKKSADKAQEQIATGAGDTKFYEEKINTANFYMSHILPLAMAHKETVIHGAQSVNTAQF